MKRGKRNGNKNVDNRMEDITKTKNLQKKIVRF